LEAPEVVHLVRTGCDYEADDERAGEQQEQTTGNEGRVGTRRGEHWLDVHSATGRAQ
jgi:hypothetical protein